MAATYQKGSYQDYLNRAKGATQGKKFTFVLINKNTASSLIDAFGKPVVYVGQYTIPNISVINEKNKDGFVVQRTIRYLPGESSIYKDEQSNDKDVPKKNHGIKFVNGKKIVTFEEPQLLEFLMKCNQNLSNPERRISIDIIPVFELFDNSVAVLKEIATDKLISQVTAWCWDENKWDEQKAYARVLNVDLTASSDEVKHNLKAIAMRDPEKFMADLKSPVMRKKHYVLEAIDRQYLLLDPTSNSISWKNNPHAPIAVAPAGQSAIDVLVHKLSTDEGQLMYQTIVDMVLPPEVSVTTSMAIPSAAEIEAMKQSNVKVHEPLPAVEESDAELMDITNKAIELKLVTLSGNMWYKYKGESFKKKEGFVEGLKKNPAMLKSLQYEIKNATIIA